MADVPDLLIATDKVCFVAVKARQFDLGRFAFQRGEAIGLQECAVDIEYEKLARARKLGAETVVNAKSKRVVEAVRRGARDVLISAPSLVGRVAEFGGITDSALPMPGTLEPFATPQIRRRERLGAFKQRICMARKRGSCVRVALPPAISVRRCSMSSPIASSSGGLCRYTRGHNGSTTLRRIRQGQGRHRVAGVVGDQLRVGPLRARGG